MLLKKGDNIVLLSYGKPKIIRGKICNISAKVFRRNDLYCNRGNSDDDMITYIQYFIWLKTKKGYKYIRHILTLYVNKRKYMSYNVFRNDMLCYSITYRKPIFIGDYPVHANGVTIYEIYNDPFKKTLREQIDIILCKKDDQYKIITNKVLSFLFIL